MSSSSHLRPPTNMQTFVQTVMARKAAKKWHDMACGGNDKGMVTVRAGAFEEEENLMEEQVGRVSDSSITVAVEQKQGLEQEEKLAVTSTRAGPGAVADIGKVQVSQGLPSSLPELFVCPSV